MTNENLLAVKKRGEKKKKGHTYKKLQTTQNIFYLFLFLFSLFKSTHNIINTHSFSAIFPLRFCSNSLNPRPIAKRSSELQLANCEGILRIN